MLLQAAGIVRASLSRSISIDAVTAANQLKDLFNLFGNEEIEDFSQFLENIENGFASAPGNTNTSPNGRPIEQRPRVRDIGVQNNGTN